MAEILRREIALACSPAAAFRLFTEKVDLWWPRSHRKHRDGVLSFELHDAGRLLDTAPDGTMWAMGVLTGIEPPRRLTLDWFPGSPRAPTHVEIVFAADAGGTLVTIVHTASTREAIEIWPQRVATFAAGWEAVLAALASATGSPPP